MSAEMDTPGAAVTLDGRVIGEVTRTEVTPDGITCQIRIYPDSVPLSLLHGSFSITPLPEPDSGGDQ